MDASDPQVHVISRDSPSNAARTTTDVPALCISAPMGLTAPNASKVGWGGFMLALPWTPCRHWWLQGNPSTIFIVSTATAVTLRIRSTIYVGSSCSSHQSLGSLTIFESLSVLTWYRSMIQPRADRDPSR